jgi:hypothetical protein
LHGDLGGTGVPRDIGKTLLKDPEDRRGAVAIQGGIAMVRACVTGEAGPAPEILNLPLDRRGQTQTVEDDWPKFGGDALNRGNGGIGLGQRIADPTGNPSPCHFIDWLGSPFRHPDQIDLQASEILSKHVVNFPRDGHALPFPDGLIARREGTELFIGEPQLLVASLQFDAFHFQLSHEHGVVFLHHQRVVRCERCRADRAARLDELREQAEEEPGRRRLPHVAISAATQGEFFIAGRKVGARVRNERKVAQLGIAADLTTKPVSVHARHEDIGNDRVEFPASQNCQRSNAVRGLFHRHALRLKGHAQELQIARDVVHDENFHGAANDLAHDD